MLNIESVNHIGIRIRDRISSVNFYENLGFKVMADVGFDEGHPIIMQHPSGVVLNLLGPATTSNQEYILMDVDEKHPDYTHIALTVTSLEAAKDFLRKSNIELTGSFSFKGMSAVFFRDPDRNVIELDAYDGNASGDPVDYSEHP